MPYKEIDNSGESIWFWSVPTLTGQTVLPYAIADGDKQVAVAFYGGNHGKRLLATGYVGQASPKEVDGFLGKYMGKDGEVNGFRIDQIKANGKIVPIRVRKIPDKERKIVEELLKEEFPGREYPAGLWIF
jgi:hypothetical protein